MVFLLKNLVFFGAGGLARETVQLINDINDRTPTYRLLGFVVEEKYYKKNAMVGGYPVLGTEEWLLDNKEDVCCNCTIGTPSAKARIQRSLESQGVMFETLISPRTIIRERSTIGRGCLIPGAMGTIISVDCFIGDGVFLNGTVTLGHDVSVGDYSCVFSGTKITGWCKIGSEVFIGGNAYVVPKRKVGDHAIIASGSVVFTNVKEGTTVLGNPAKRMASLEA